MKLCQTINKITLFTAFDGYFFKKKRVGHHYVIFLAIIVKPFYIYEYETYLLLYESKMSQFYTNMNRRYNYPTLFMRKFFLERIFFLKMLFYQAKPTILFFADLQTYSLYLLSIY